MTFGISPGVYPVETNKSVVVPAVATMAAAIVVHSTQGPSNVPTLITTNKQLTDTYGAPTPSNPSMYAALAYLQQGNALWVVRVISGATKAQFQWMDTQATPANTFTVYAANEGAWGNNLSVTLVNNNTSQANTFFINVSYNGVQVESFLVTKNASQLDGFGKSMYLPNVVNGVSEYITVTDISTDTFGPEFTTPTHPLAGGTDDTSAVTDAIVNTGYNLFASKESYDVTILINGGWDTVAVVTNLITLAKTRGNAIAVLDTPQSANTPTLMTTYSTTTINANSSYAAMYGGWVQIYDSFNDVTLYAPPSGFVAGVMAYTQQVGNAWDAPAGVNRGVISQATGVQYVFAEGDRDALQQANVNPIQSFSGQGIFVYGQKTLTSIPSALSRVNVRMLLITIEKAITIALRPFVFEVNDAFTQENIVSLITNYMDVVKTKNGVYDYQVVCDATNNPPAVVDSNELVVDLYIKPTRTAEYIQLNTIVSATGVVFNQ